MPMLWDAEDGVILSYPLPEEEDLERVRADIRARHESDIRARVRDKVLDDFADGLFEFSAVEPEVNRRVEGALAPILRRATTYSWDKIRTLIYERDAARCHPCGRLVKPRDYECGHIIDRCAGGTDRLSNLVAMCGLCNRRKPVHEMRAEYIAWAAETFENTKAIAHLLLEEA